MDDQENDIICGRVLSVCELVLILSFANVFILLSFCPSFLSLSAGSGFGISQSSRLSSSVSAMRVLNTGSDVEEALADALVWKLKF